MFLSQSDQPCYLLCCTGQIGVLRSHLPTVSRRAL
jgi:hypothetical protein